jgi:hypothetical protein
VKAFRARTANRGAASGQGVRESIPDFASDRNWFRTVSLIDASASARARAPLTRGTRRVYVLQRRVSGQCPNLTCRSALGRCLCSEARRRISVPGSRSPCGQQSCGATIRLTSSMSAFRDPWEPLRPFADILPRCAGNHRIWSHTPPKTPRARGDEIGDTFITAQNRRLPSISCD